METRAAIKRAVLRVYPGAGDLKRRLLDDRRPARREVGALRRQVRELRARVEELETEVQEARQLNKRVAELTDIVAEVLLPVDRRDEDRIREGLERYARGS
jgi:hypothetical protein